MSEHLNRTSSRPRRAPNRADEVVSLAPQARTPDAPESPPSALPITPEVNELDRLCPTTPNARVERIFEPLDTLAEPSHAHASSEDSEQPLLSDDGDNNDQEYAPALESPDDSSDEEEYNADAQRFRAEVVAAQNARLPRQPAPRARPAQDAEPSKLPSIPFTRHK